VAIARRRCRGSPAIPREASRPFATRRTFGLPPHPTPSRRCCKGETTKPDRGVCVSLSRALGRHGNRPPRAAATLAARVALPWLVCFGPAGHRYEMSHACPGTAFDGIGSTKWRCRLRVNQFLRSRYSGTKKGSRYGRVSIWLASASPMNFSARASKCNGRRADRRCRPLESRGIRQMSLQVLERFARQRAPPKVCVGLSNGLFAQAVRDVAQVGQRVDRCPSRISAFSSYRLRLRCSR